MMNNGIGISTEKQLSGNWVKIFIPTTIRGKAVAILQNEQGDLLKRVNLEGGNNAIDTSHITNQTFIIKVETPHETILKHIKFDR